MLDGSIHGSHKCGTYTRNGRSGSWTLALGIFAVTLASGPGISQQEIDKLFSPTISQLNQTSIPYQYNSQSFPTWLQSFEAFNLPSANVSSYIIGSRLIASSVIDVQQTTSYLFFKLSFENALSQSETL